MALSVDKLPLPPPYLENEKEKARALFLGLETQVHDLKPLMSVRSWKRLSHLLDLNPKKLFKVSNPRKPKGERLSPKYLELELTGLDFNKKKCQTGWG